MKFKSKSKLFKIKKLPLTFRSKKTMHGATLIQVFIAIAIIGLIAAYVVAKIVNS